ncbi:Uncharacterised protein [Bordetella pertussis]|nr:Uncharacterised protein [Bordetella pertussis]
MAGGTYGRATACTPRSNATGPKCSLRVLGWRTTRPDCRSMSIQRYAVDSDRPSCSLT